MSVRLSPEEYESCLAICSAQGIRNVSDLARTAIRNLTGSGKASDPLWGEVGDLRKQIRSLSEEVERLSRVLEARE